MRREGLIKFEALISLNTTDLVAKLHFLYSYSFIYRLVFECKYDQKV